MVYAGYHRHLNIKRFKTGKIGPTCMNEIVACYGVYWVIEGNWGSKGTFSTWNRLLAFIPWYCGWEFFLLFLFIFWMGFNHYFSLFSDIPLCLNDFFDITGGTFACLNGEDIKSLGFSILNHQWLRISNLEDSGSWILGFKDSKSWGYRILRILYREVLESRWK